MALYLRYTLFCTAVSPKHFTFSLRVARVVASPHVLSCINCSFPSRSWQMRQAQRHSHHQQTRLQQPVSSYSLLPRWMARRRLPLPPYLNQLRRIRLNVSATCCWVLWAVMLVIMCVVAGSYGDFFFFLAVQFINVSVLSSSARLSERTLWHVWPNKR